VKKIKAKTVTLNQTSKIESRKLSIDLKNITCGVTKMNEGIICFYY